MLLLSQRISSNILQWALQQLQQLWELTFNFQTVVSENTGSNFKHPRRSTVRSPTGLYVISEHVFVRLHLIIRISWGRSYRLMLLRHMFMKGSAVEWANASPLPPSRQAENNTDLINSSSVGTWPPGRPWSAVLSSMRVSCIFLNSPSITVLMDTKQCNRDAKVVCPLPSYAGGMLRHTIQRLFTLSIFHQYSHCFLPPHSLLSYFLAFAIIRMRHRNIWFVVAILGDLLAAVGYFNICSSLSAAIDFRMIRFI